MAITISKKKKKQKYLIFAFLGVVVITAVILWFGYFKEEKSEGSTVPVGKSYRKINVDVDFLTSETLKQMKDFERIEPLEVEETGRENPFFPY